MRRTLEATVYGATLIIMIAALSFGCGGSVQLDTTPPEFGDMDASVSLNPQGGIEMEMHTEGSWSILYWDAELDIFGGTPNDGVVVVLEVGVIGFGTPELPLAVTISLHWRFTSPPMVCVTAGPFNVCNEATKVDIGPGLNDSRPNSAREPSGVAL